MRTDELEAMHIKTSLNGTQIRTDPIPHAIEAMILNVVALFYLCGVAIIDCAVVQKPSQPGTVCWVRGVGTGDPDAVNQAVIGVIWQPLSLM